jgi:hypothetical protein
VHCFKIIPEHIVNEPITVYFYDGFSSFDSLKQAFTYYNQVFNPLFIAVVDDWNWDFIRNGTRAAFEELKYEVIYEVELPAKGNGDRKQWWNGLYVALIRKSNHEVPR